MKLSQLTRSRPLDISVDIDGDRINATIDRGCLGTDKYYAFKTWREQLGYLLITWDTTDENGDLLVPNEKAPDRVAAWVALFEPLPDAVLWPLFMEAGNQSRMGKTRGGN